MTERTIRDALDRRSQTTSGISFETYQRREDDPTLLLLMGYSGNLDVWTDQFLNLLLERFKVILMDYRGSGKSIKPKEPSLYSITEMSKDVIDVLDTLKIEKVNLLGYSLGGTIALQMAYDHQDRISGLVLMSSTIGGVNYVAPESSVWSVLVAPDGDTILEKSESIWKVCLPVAKYLEFRPTLISTFERSSSSLTPRFALAGQLKGYKDFRFDDASWTPGFPIGIIHGENDRVTPVGNAHNIARILKSAQMLILKNCEHMPYLEEPDEVVVFLAHVLN